jgi:hypothetical protein
MAQTTRLTSFGPILIPAAFHVSPCSVFRSLHTIHAITLVRNKIRGEKKTYLGPNDASVVWARPSHYRCPL